MATTATLRRGRGEHGDRHDDAPRMLKPEFVAHQADVHIDTIYRMIKAGKLPAAKLGRHYRIPREAAEALLAGRLP